MESIKELVDNFCDTHNLERSIECENGVVDNGAKSITSIMSKIKRESVTSDTVCLSNLTDLTRCAILVDKYSNVIPLLIELSKRVDNLNGHISRQSSGYIGIHLTSTIHNIPAEIQLSTKDVWLAKQASEHIYAKYREFDKTKNKQIQSLLLMPECEEKNRQRAEFKKNYLAFKSDYKQVNDLYKEIHKQTDFYDNLDGIEGLILAYNIKNQKADNSPYDYNFLLNKNLIEKGELVEKDALSIITEIRPILNQTQEELVRSMGLAINLASSNNTKLTEDEKSIIKLRNNIEEVFKNYFHEGAIVNYSDTYGNLI